VFRHACKLGLEGVVSKRKLSLSLGPLARLAQDEECKCSSREARSGGGLGQAALAMKPRTHFKHTIDQLDRGAETIAAVE
jgi:hypothetical protein